MSCIGMEYLHQKKMMHRDLKSSNGILYSNLCTKTFKNPLAYKVLNLGMDSYSDKCYSYKLWLIMVNNIYDLAYQKSVSLFALH